MLLLATLLGGFQQLCLVGFGGEAFLSHKVNFSRMQCCWILTHFCLVSFSWLGASSRSQLLSCDVLISNMNTRCLFTSSLFHFRVFECTVLRIATRLCIQQFLQGVIVSLIHIFLATLIFECQGIFWSKKKNMYSLMRRLFLHPYIRCNLGVFSDFLTFQLRYSYSSCLVNVES